MNHASEKPVVQDHRHLRYATTWLPDLNSTVPRSRCEKFDLLESERFAYVFMIVRRAKGGDTKYRGFIYNMLLAQEMMGNSVADFVAIVIGPLEEEDLALLSNAHFILKRFDSPPGGADINYASICLSKLYTLSLVEYNKVMYLDADIIPEKNLDFIFQWPVDAAFTAGHLEPVQGGWFLVRPSLHHFEQLISVAEWRLQQEVDERYFDINAFPVASFYGAWHNRSLAMNDRVSFLWTNKFGQEGKGWGSWAGDDRGLWMLYYFVDRCDDLLVLQVRSKVPSRIRIRSEYYRLSAGFMTATSESFSKAFPQRRSNFVDHWTRSWRATRCRSREDRELHEYDIIVPKFHFAGSNKPWNARHLNNHNDLLWHRLYEELRERRPELRLKQLGLDSTAMRQVQKVMRVLAKHRTELEFHVQRSNQVYKEKMNLQMLLANRRLEIQKASPV